MPGPTAQVHTAIKVMAPPDPTRDGGEEHSAGAQPNEVDLRAVLYVALMVIIGSTTAAAAKIAVRELPVAWLPVVRFGLAGLCLLPLAWRPAALINDRAPRPEAAVPVGRVLRADQSGLLSDGGAAGADLARRDLLRHLSAGRLAGGVGDAAGASGPGPALGRARERRGNGGDRRSATCGTAAGPRPAEVRRRDDRRPLAGRRGAVVGRLPHGEQAAGCASRRDARAGWRPCSWVVLLSLPIAIVMGPRVVDAGAGVVVELGRPGRALAGDHAPGLGRFRTCRCAGLTRARSPRSAMARPC